MRYDMYHMETVRVDYELLKLDGIRSQSRAFREFSFDGDRT